MTQSALFNVELGKEARHDLGGHLAIGLSAKRARLYLRGLFIKEVDLSDRVATRLFVVEAAELGAKQNRLADALGMSRQTIHNYREIKRHFGLEGLIRGYSLAQDRRTQRREHTGQAIKGSKAREVAVIRQREREKRAEDQGRQGEFNFSFGADTEAERVPVGEQPFSEEHDWEATRYAGVFVYVIALIVVWRWLALVMGHFGGAYKMFMVFLLMAARDIRSLEQLKNVRQREAGVIVGLRRVLSKPKLWEWFYAAADKGISTVVLRDYFAHQIRTGLVGVWQWFTDGHRLPYTGKERVHYSYNTQRRMPMPGHTSLVTSDDDGRIVDFQIQEGQGDLRAHIRSLSRQWSEPLDGETPIHVFDREGYGAPFFWTLVRGGIPFVTWDKNLKAQQLRGIPDEQFTEEFEFNGKRYRVFENEKSFTYKPDEPEAPGTWAKPEEQTFVLRRICIWNQKSDRRACGLAWTGERPVRTEDCARAILSRWGASENTFKHCKDRHPLHYHPGFKLVESERQEIANPAIKDQEGLIRRLEKNLNSLRKKLGKAKAVLNQDGTPRQNSRRERLKQEIADREAKVERLQVEKRQLPETVDVSSLEDYACFKRIDTEGKNLFDFVTTSVWNARKQMVEWLRPIFRNDQEVVDLFYAITACHGWIKSTPTEVVVRLEPLEQPSRRAAQEQLCRRLCGLLGQTPMGKWLIISVGESPLRS